ncbi:MAG: diphosphomevalonate decarboxylase [Candidatus Sericytochromatia bacterium]|nr:diphosphomevalonate decarboxylase [Candidatus Sericytochromatia bacterium]
MTGRTATARAQVNIALIKYWGKRDERLHLPTNGSLSLTLEGLHTTTTVTFSPELPTDVFVRDGAERDGEEARRVGAFLDLVRVEAGLSERARVVSRNEVPTAGGLASSASGFAALAAAASRAAGLPLDEVALSCLARRGSGSACRSIYGGFVEWRRGERPDGRDSHGVQLAPESHWENLRLVVSQLSSLPKDRTSRDGMRDTVRTSPFYPGWLATVDADLALARAAIAARDLEALGEVAERNALKMHATMLGAVPAFTYWMPASLAAMQAVWQLRREGVPAWFTMDAGPHVKVVTEEAQLARVSAALTATPGVERVRVCSPGGGLRWLNEPLQP